MIKKQCISSRSTTFERCFRKASYY